jgi:hypothetical protein
MPRLVEALLQIADHRFARHQELVHQDVPRAHREPAIVGEPSNRGFGLGANGEVVVDDRHLPVEQEVGVARVGVEPGE